MAPKYLCDDTVFNAKQKKKIKQKHNTHNKKTRARIYQVYKIQL